MDEELIRKLMDTYRSYDPGVLSGMEESHTGEEREAIRRLLAQHADSPGEAPAPHPRHTRPRRGAFAKRPPFGVYLLSFLFPPGYFFLRKRPGAAVFSLIMFFVSVPLYFLFILPGFLLWFANAIWGGYSLRNEMMDVHIREQARAIADEMTSREGDGAR